MENEDQKSAGNWFGNLDLGYKYGIVLGSLIFLTFVLGFSKLLYNTQREKKLMKESVVAASPAKEELHNLNRREEEEGDLFGIRALENGFYGGVAQSRPATPISGGSSNLTLVAPRSAHVSRRSSSDTGHLKPGHNNTNIGLAVAAPGRDNVDMHLIVPPSPTHTRFREETRSPSPTGSTNSQASSSAPSGFNVKTHSNQPVSPRVQLKSPAPIASNPYTTPYNTRSPGMESDPSSPRLQLSPSSPPRNAGAERTFVAWNPNNAQAPTIPRVVIDSSQDDSQYTGKASGLEDSTRGYAPYTGGNNYSEATTRPNASSLVRSGSDRQGNNRASNASFAEFYDSYYDNRLSTMKEENVGRI
ncbi:hypothetical protein DFH27DRAFT_605381 [Peziza echinospora]|nr:hypothetical protein DFH27DRAFT_605381 [Peziza echinospora]